MVKRRVITLLKYGLGFGILAGVIWFHWDVTSEKGEAIGLSAALTRPIHLGPLVLALAIGGASVALTFVRWYVLVRAQDLPFTLANAFRLGMVGFFFNTLLPGSVGGDIIKATCIAREQSRRTVAVATVLLDRAVGLCGLVYLVAFLGGLAWLTGQLQTLARPEDVPILQTIILGAGAIVVLSLVFWIVLGFLSSARAELFAGRLERLAKVGPALAEFWRSVWLYRCRGRSVALGLLLATIGHAGFVLTFFFAAQTLTPAREIPSLGTHFLVVPVGMTLEAGFPAPGGVGGGEIGFGTLYAILGFDFIFGVLGSLVRRAISWILGFVGYLVYLRMKPQLQPSPSQGPK